ncbi:adenosylcobinamide-GDP ribazoletransferase [Pseudomonas sp. C27(2019)]|uniref:adenosylcobinamide-GDP ribazoletransferase n=1 Tax=Pseudomonas sp. C27(2019) TaxID=2604941 RepID=UPI0012451357|nr:adenosylcobinamide-GDP ribazoletransferase [Pseudomonas sp. C27(2019)]QEY58882.1 adenosylcobinamide-GDP ribazoletransferase [Pseudomonas sp. C27(2019)]
MSTYYWGFWFALTFLSRVPGPYLKRLDQEVQQAAMWFYPVVGAILGLLLVTLVTLCFYYNPQASVFLVAALVLALWVYFTGAMHLDGVADTADAWVGGLGDHTRTLEIMKDPRVGAMAVAAMLVVLLVKFAAISALLVQAQADIGLLLGGLVLIPMLARAGIIGLMATSAYVRPQGMVSTTQSAATKSKVTVMGIVLAVLGIWMLQGKALMLLLLWITLLVAYRAALNKRLGGYTGDTLGAGVEFQETVLLVALAL